MIHSLGPFLIAGWTPFISTRMHQLHEDLSRSQDFGNYHLEKLVGRGGMGEVWLARHRLLRRDAAVKLVSAGLLEHAGHSERRHLQRRFESEAQAIASLRSPHTVAIYDYGLAENGSLYYVMEYLQGMDAEVLVHRYGPQPAGRVVWLLRQVCDSLEEAHDAGLVHRDIKGSNVFVCRLGKSADFVKVLDFGLVKNLTGASRTALTGDRTSGTPAFMSPEQVRGEDIDARADIYGLGCLSLLPADRLGSLQQAGRPGHGRVAPHRTTRAAFDALGVAGSAIPRPRRDGLSGKEPREPAAVCGRASGDAGQLCGLRTLDCQPTRFAGGSCTGPSRLERRRDERRRSNPVYHGDGGFGPADGAPSCRQGVARRHFSLPVLNDQSARDGHRGGDRLNRRQHRGEPDSGTVGPAAAAARWRSS